MVQGALPARSACQSEGVLSETAQVLCPQRSEASPSEAAEEEVRF